MPMLVCLYDCVHVCVVVVLLYAVSLRTLFVITSTKKELATSWSNAK